MTVMYLSKHEVGLYDTVESLTRDYGLSWNAIRDIPANQHLRDRLPDSGRVAAGLLLSIPPHPGRLVRDRLIALNQLRPLFMGHFQRLVGRAETELRPLLEAEAEPASSALVRAKMGELEREAGEDIQGIATAAQPLAALCASIAHTHVASESDRRVVVAGDPQSALYWLLSVDKVRAWESLWRYSHWSARWSGQDGEAAWLAVAQLTNTLRSIAIQSVDEKLRADQRLESRLIVELSDAADR